MCHFAAEDGEEALQIIRKLFSYIPQNNLEEAPLVECNDPIDRLEDSLNEIIPDSATRPYDMYEVIGAIVDNGEFLEIQRDYAKTSSWASPASTDRAWAWLPTSPNTLPACSTATHRAKAHASSASATHSTFLW